MRQLETMDSLHRHCHSERMALERELDVQGAEVKRLRERERSLLSQLSMTASMPSLPPPEPPSEDPAPPHDSGAAPQEQKIRPVGDVEFLIRGYQIENERLTRLLKGKEGEVKRARTAFEEERVQWNKEINKLRNALVGDAYPEFELQERGPLVSGNRQQANTTDAPVDQASSSTKVNSSMELSSKEAELKRLRLENSNMFNEINRLRKVLRPIQSSCVTATASATRIGLTAEDVYGPRAVERAREEVEELTERLDSERRSHAEAIRALEDRLKFFAATQELLSVNEAAKEELRQEVALLRRELAKTGGGGRRRGGQESEVPGSDSPNASFASATSRASARPRSGNNRSAADIKRIRWVYGFAGS